jgi:tetrahydromethanopterin S-methyltransferase subunit C
MSITVVCIAPNELSARGILQALRGADIPKSDVSVLFADAATTKGFAHELHTKAPEGAATGASTGGLLGGVLGWLVGIGSIAIPGVGPFIAAGPILAALSGAAIGAAVGGIAGTLVGLGIPEIEAKRYEVKVRDGGVMISIAAADHRAAYRIRTILRSAGAEEIATSLKVSVISSSKAPPTVRIEEAEVPITRSAKNQSVHS